MAIEIRELVIRATVVQEGTQAGASTEKGNNSISTNEEIVRICVDRILEIIKDKKDR